MTHVRPAVPDDMPAVAALRYRWVVDENGATEHAARDAFVRSFVRWAADHARSHRCAVADDDGRVVGMAWTAILDRVPSPRALDRRSADVQSVYVVPERRGEGLGRMLVEAVVDTAADAGAERVVVHSSPAAVPVYARVGFASTERLQQRSIS